MTDADDLKWRSQLFNLSSASSPVEIVDQVVRQAIKLSASDVLFEPQEKDVLVRLRVDGVLQGYGVMPLGAYDQVLARLKVLGNMDVAENRKPQESKIRLEVDDHPYVLRVSVISTNFGQMAALRLLDLPQYSDLEQLGMSADVAHKIESNISGRYGLFLVCGPTGSGKTTTVHSCLQQLNTGEVNIMTIEDPIEYVMGGINQLEIGEGVGLDFARGLKLILRLNPDIIFIGEIRDAETAKIAVRASLTGHLVISTVHSRNSVGALYRLLDLGIEPSLVNYVIRAVVGQRLMRRVCEHCRQVYQPTPEEKELYIKEKGSPPAQLMHGTKCEFCHMTRYKGRVGVYEILEMNDEIRKMVIARVGETDFREELKKQGFVDINQEGLKLVDTGVTSLREYMRTLHDAR